MTEHDAIAEALQRGGPAIDDVRARVARARVAASLFGTAEPIRIGRYEVERQLGAGGGGVVFAARDPELSRKVAIKLLVTHGSRERMLAEGHALARLSHPNVVPIFDVGTHEDQIYLVMELVEGGTLRTWLEAAPRTVRAIVRAYRDAGAGLAAAHRAGFVHRDFKPDNALIGTDHRVRVVDFGLVHTDGEARAGLGTPRYMPPEQAEGGEVTPAADQYAFCASLSEAIRARKDERGVRADASPGWLDAILGRGLARDPAARWPTMDALLDALARDPATRWRRRGALAGVLALGGVAFAIGRTQAEALPECDGGRTELARVWTPETRSELLAHLDTLGTAYAKQVGPEVVASLDRYTHEWSAGHLGACKAHRRGTQSDALFDRRMRCLDTARAALGAAVTAVREVSADGVAPAVVAIGGLPAVARCSDSELLLANITPPLADLDAAVRVLEQALAAREVDLRANRPNTIVAIDALVRQARELGYAPALAKALRLRGVAAIDMNVRKEAVAPLTEAMSLAFANGDTELGVEAFARRAWSDGTREYGDPVDALANADAIEAIARGLPAGAHATRALLANNVGSIELARGRRSEARAAYARASAEKGDVTGTAAIELAQIPANYALAVDDPRKRDALFAQAIAQLTALVGKSHPFTLDARIMAAIWSADAVASERELTAACGELVALHPERRARIDECSYEAAWLALARDDTSAAKAWFGRIVAGSSKIALLASAHVARLEGDRVLAERRLAELQLDDQTTWWRRLPAIERAIAQGLVARDSDDRAHARAYLEHARTLLTANVADMRPTRQRRLAFVERMLTSLRGSP
jgi:hypothetical protein